MEHIYQLLEMTSIFEILIFVFRRNQRNNGYEKNDFQFLLLLYVAGAYAQITLEECQRKTQDNYPLVHQYGLVEKTKEYNLENAAKGYLPQFALSAKASYQSDVTEIPVKLPGVDLKGLPKDQYQVMLELQQKIWDGEESVCRRSRRLQRLKWRKKTECRYVCAE